MAGWSASRPAAGVNPAERRTAEAISEPSGQRESRPCKFVWTKSAQRLALEHQQQKELLGQHEAVLEAQFQAAQKALLEEFVQKEKRLAGEWAKKDQSAARTF